MATCAGRLVERLPTGCNKDRGVHIGFVSPPVRIPIHPSIMRFSTPLLVLAGARLVAGDESIDIDTAALPATGKTGVTAPLPTVYLNLQQVTDASTLAVTTTVRASNLAALDAAILLVAAAPSSLGVVYNSEALSSNKTTLTSVTRNATSIVTEVSSSASLATLSGSSSVATSSSPSAAGRVGGDFNWHLLGLFGLAALLVAATW